MQPAPQRDPVYGLMAEFPSMKALIAAAENTRAAGYEKVDAYTPYPDHDLIHALGHHGSRVPLIVLIGGIVGCLTGFGLQYWVSVIAYPLNVGGRPLNSWPAFIPVTFEMTVLFAGLSAVVGMLMLNGLPRPFHPVFGAKGFERATTDGFFLCIEAEDPKYDRQDTETFLRSLDPSEVQEVAS